MGYPFEIGQGGDFADGVGLTDRSRSAASRTVRRRESAGSASASRLTHFVSNWGSKNFKSPCSSKGEDTTDSISCQTRAILTVPLAKEALFSFLRSAAMAGHRCVIIIHGKGHGSFQKQPVLKGKLNLWLQRRKDILAFSSARPADGGTGAVYVLLRR